MVRREFIKKLIKVFFVLIAAVFSVVTVIFSYPAGIRQKKYTFFSLMTEDGLPIRGVKRFDYHFKSERQGVSGELTGVVYIVNNTKKIYALSPVCTHLGCLVTYNRHKNEFSCPCHGGRYDTEGTVLGGPPPEPLTRLPLKIENGHVFIGFKI
ncbi:MAG: Rieske 2Fe-2S domain-containing protein [Nitrospirae bacterium YQR-1]